MVDVFFNILAVLIFSILPSVIIIGPLKGLYEKKRGNSFVASWKKTSIFSSVFLFIILGFMVFFTFEETGEYTLSAVIIPMIIMAILVGVVIGTAISLIASLFGKKKMWKIATISSITILLCIGLLTGLISFFEDKPYVEKMDKKFSSIKKDTSNPSKDHILFEHYYSGNKGQAKLIIVGNNYNNKSFKGLLTVTASRDGIVLSKKQLKVDIMNLEKAYSESIYLNRLNVKQGRYDDRPDGVEYDFKIDGEFY